MIIGHEELQKEFRKLAGEGELAQGYIFYGPARVGKFAFACALANQLENKIFERGSRAPLGDTLFLRSDETGSIGIDRVREVKRFIWQKPNRSARRTLIIDNADLLTDEAQNALLKIAEEPPPSGLVILIIDDPEKIRPTLQSRFPKVYFGPVSAKKIEKWLEAEHGLTEASAVKLAAGSIGLPGLAIELMDKNSKLNLRLGQAGRYLKAQGVARVALVKEILESEEFQLDNFLEALAIYAAQSGYEQPRFWHQLLGLRRQASYFNLNPKIQLIALGKTIS
ncbi:MAG: AAA family ATPase [Candidatus Liptonbacteria bacterium]